MEKRRTRKEVTELLGKLDAWLQEQLDNFQTPRQRDIIEVGKSLGLSRRLVLRHLKNQNEAYQTTGRPQAPWPQKIHRNHLVHFYGTVSVDLAFFGKRSNILSSLGISKTEMGPTFVMIDMGTHFAVVKAMGPKGKSAKNTLRVMKWAFQEYKKQFKIYPHTLCSDNEKAIVSSELKSYFQSTFTKLYIYKFSRTKALFAENLIRNLRSSISILKKHHKRKKISWPTIIERIVKGYNNRPLTLFGKKMSFTPRQITPETFNEFKAELRNKFEGYSFSSFSIHPSLFKWRLPIGTRVFLPKRAVQVPGFNDKLSANPLSDTIFVIVRRVVQLNVKQQLIQTVILREESPPIGRDPILLQKQESICIPVDM